MMGVIFVKTFAEPQFNISEIMRYMGSRENDTLSLALARECIEYCRNKLLYKVCYGIFPIDIRNCNVDFPFMQVESCHLAKNLCRCKEAIVFAATVGLGPDRLISKYSRISPSKALAFQSIGAERIESLCDVFCKSMEDEYSARGLFPRPRFSPGYGDFAIDAQKDIFRVLDCSKKIGLTLNNSMLMSPSKSVTAVIGLAENKIENNFKKCTNCQNIDCCFRSDQ